MAAYGRVRHLATRFDAKQIICTVIGGVFGVGLIFLVGIHIGKQVGGRMPGTSDEATAAPATEGAGATATASLAVDSSAVAAQSSSAAEPADYRFFALLDAPAPTRELPTVELAMNPVLEERQNRRNRKQEAAAAATASAGEAKPVGAATKVAAAAPAEAPSKAARREAAKAAAAPASSVAIEVADAPLTAAAPAAAAEPREPDIDRILAASPAATRRASRPETEAAVERKPVAAKEEGAAAATAKAEPTREVAALEKAEPRKAKAKSAAGRFTVQVSAFQDKAVADALAEDFRRRGHKVHVKHEEIPGRGSWYRVQVGRFESRDAAAEARSTIKRSDGYDGFVTSM